MANHNCRVIENLVFEVPPQGIVSFLGRSGAGKTTLLRMIAGLERRFDGHILVGDKLVTKPSRDIQIVFQDYRIMPWKTVYENIEFALQQQNGPMDRAQIEKWIAIVGLQDKRNEWPKNLSGGEVARVAFARAFVSPPQILLLDEPFLNLDLITKFDLQNELIRDLKTQKASVVLVSHSIDDAVFLSDTIHLLSDRPMKIEKTFAIDVSRPRQRGDRELSEISAEIARYLAARRFTQSQAVTPLGHHSDVFNSTVVICPARVSMLPLDQAEDSGKDKGVCDGIADCGTCAGGQRPRGGLPRLV